MTTIVISPSNVVSYPEGGGHFWVFMQYAQGLRRLGCEVYWLEHFPSSGSREQDAQLLATFRERMARHGFDGKTLLYRRRPSGEGFVHEYIEIPWTEAEVVLRRADLLLNFYYAIDSSLLAHFRCTALVNIDPGLLEFWIATGQLEVPAHDYYFTTGETVGTAAALFPNCGLSWHYIRPPVCLELWPYVYTPDSEVFTTISSWWGGNGKGEWITDGKDVFYENNKRVSFLQFVELPCRIPQILELALCLGRGDPEDDATEVDPRWRPENLRSEEATDYVGDAQDWQMLERHGWRLCHAHDVAGSPDRYRAYIQGSRGEFSCAKPSCMRFQNAWVSDRTLCYLASGKPVVVQHTGPSAFLPNGEGMFRFSTLEEAVAALAAIDADYERHCRAAREITEAHFDAKDILEKILRVTTGAGGLRVDTEPPELRQRTELITSVWQPTSVRKS